MTKYDEMVEKAAEKFGHCRVAGGLDDHDIARQVLEAAGITRGSVEPHESAAETEPADGQTQYVAFGSIAFPKTAIATDLPTGASPQE